MNTYGYAKQKDLNEHGLMKMSEVTISATPEELRRISDFIAKCADEMEGSNASEHEHYCDYDEDYDESGSDLIVIIEKAKK